MNPDLACFISPHGYGHATRTIALLQAVQGIIPNLTARLFTVAPPALFEQTGLSLAFNPVAADVGLVQTDAFTADQDQTVARLADLLPFRQTLVDTCVDQCRSCRLILCDISSLGIEVGRAAGIPSVLVENFTWDWIYERLDPPVGALIRFAEILRNSYLRADYRIQTEPLCNPVDCDLRCGPIARRPLLPRDEIRQKLGSADRKIVLITLGGIPLALPFMEQLSSYGDYLFVVAGQSGSHRASANLCLLDRSTPLHHPDLINGADLVLCKSGYSTIAEVQQTGTPICCISRNNFAESAVLDRYVVDAMNGTILDQDQFFRGDWLAELPELLQRRRTPAPVNGADQAASFIASLL